MSLSTKQLEKPPKPLYKTRSFHTGLEIFINSRTSETSQEKQNARQSSASNGLEVTSPSGREETAASSNTQVTLSVYGSSI